jgi:hypothetical protein
MIDRLRNAVGRLNVVIKEAALEHEFDIAACMEHVPSEMAA